jgi:hypothetical protein
MKTLLCVLTCLVVTVAARGKTYEETEKLMKSNHVNATIAPPTPSLIPPPAPQVIVKKPTTNTEAKGKKVSSIDDPLTPVHNTEFHTHPDQSTNEDLQQLVNDQIKK